jgi:hypothetical protein
MQSHTGSFVIANFDRMGRVQPITTGINLKTKTKEGGDDSDEARDGDFDVGGGDEAGLREYAEAQCRRAFLIKNWSALLLQAKTTIA